MAQFKFESNGRDEIRQERQPMREAKSTSSASASAVDSFMSFFVRLMGLFTLLVGLWVGGIVISEVLKLYRGPHQVERFADAIDKGSNLDKVLASFTSKKSSKRGKRREGLVDEPEVTTKNENKDALRISYFIAWIIVIFLLMLIGRLAILAIKTGGELALYDLQVKKFARQLVAEVRQPDKRHK